MSEADETPDAEPDPDPEAVQRVRDLLAARVPLTLLADLFAPEATSTEILESERHPDDAWWEADDPGSPPVRRGGE